MKFLIYGKGGWISNMIQEELSGEHEVCVSEVRVDNIKDMKEELNRILPDRVICLIGRTSGGNINSIDYLEDKPYENIRDNLFAPVSLALECQKLGIHMTYLGTGCIFSYDNYDMDLNNIDSVNIKDNIKFNTNQTFSEDDIPNFFGSQYSVVKGFTDRLMHEIQCLNLRIRMPISSHSHKRNFIDKIVSYKNICSIENSMTVLDDFIPIIVKMSIRKLIGTYNLCNPGVISHNEILTLYRKYINNTHTWTNFSLREQDNVLKAKRSNNHLDTSKIEKLYKIPDIKTSVEKIMQEFH